MLKLNNKETKFACKHKIISKRYGRLRMLGKKKVKNVGEDEYDMIQTKVVKCSRLVMSLKKEMGEGGEVCFVLWNSRQLSV